MTVQLEPTETVAPQLLLAEKSPWVLNPPTCSARLPVLLIVMSKGVPSVSDACAEGVKARLPNARLVGKIVTPVCWPMPLSAIRYAPSALSLI